MGKMIINHILYADDIVLISPSSRGLAELLNCCERYGFEHSIVFNVDKCAVTNFRSECMPKFNIPVFQLNGKVITVVDNFKYLGHILSNNMKDDKDIERQRRKIFIRVIL